MLTSFGILMAGMCLAETAAHGARCDWSVSGTLKVENARLTKMKNKFGETSPLENVLAKVSARTKVGLVWGTWNAWPQTRTDANGKFTVTNRKNCAKRQIRVQVKFDDENLEIRHETATSSLTKVKWYEVVNDGKTGRERTSSTVGLGPLEFEPGGNLFLGDFEARRHAELWNFYQMIIDHLAGKGPRFAFKTKVKVKYPHDSWVAGDILKNTVEASYSNPTTKVIYIHKDSNGSADEFDVQTLAHEIGHKWAYERFHGEICLTMDLLRTGYTHDLADDPCVRVSRGLRQVLAAAAREGASGPGPGPSAQPPQAQCRRRQSPDGAQYPRPHAAPRRGLVVRAQHLHHALYPHVRVRRAGRGHWLGGDLQVGER